MSIIFLSNNPVRPDMALAFIVAGAAIVCAGSLFLRDAAFEPALLIGAALIVTGLIGLIDLRQYRRKS